MKLSHALLCSSFVLLHTSFLQAAAFVHETQVEFSASGDFNGDAFPDVLIVDKATGLYRLGYGAGTGAVSFSQSRPTGVSNVTGIAVGRLNGVTADSFAVTSVDQNRTQILSPTSPGVTVPSTAFTTGLGPQLLAAVDLPLGAAPTAEDDLVVLASRDLTDTYQLRQIRSNAGTWPLLRTDDVANIAGRNGNPIVPAIGASSIFVHMRIATALVDGFQAYAVTGTSTTAMLSLAALPKGSQYISGIFDGTDADVMFWVPGSPNVNVRRISAGGPGWTFSSNLNSNLGFNIAQLAPVNTPAGRRVLVRYDNGLLREYPYTVASGFGAPTAITATGASGVLSGLVPMPGNAFQLLYAPAPGQPSETAVSFTNSGTGWTQTGIVTLPKLKFFSAFANVMLLDNPIFQVDHAQLLHSYQVPDWTTAVTVGPPVTASASTFSTSSTGLGTPVVTTLGTPGAAPLGTAVNQMHAQFSLFSFDANLGAAPDAVIISPDPGTYDTAQKIEFTGLNGGTTVYFRLGATGAFQAWNSASPPWLTRPVTVQYYALSTGGAGTVQSASYSFSQPPALQDADGDGVPDFVEISYGMDPNGGADTDGDGYSDREEIAAVTNPNDVGDHPTSHSSTLDAMLVDVRAQIKDTLGTTMGVAADGTHVTVTDPFGNQLGDRHIGIGTAAPAFGRVRTRAVDPAMGFLIVRTDKHFSTNPAGTNEPRGRELIGLIPALEPEVWSFATTDGAIGTPTAWSWGGTNWQAGSSNWNNGATDTQGFDSGWSTSQLDPLWDSSPTGTYSAAGWITAFQAAANRGARPYAEITLSPATSLGAVLVGKIMGDLILERDPTSTADAAELFFDDAATFSGLRRASTTVPTAGIVRAIAVLRHVDDQMAGGDLGAQALRKLARDVYALHNALAPDALDTLSMPLDALASFVQTGALPADYLAVTTLPPAERSAASAKLAAIIASIPERSSSTQTMYVRSEAPTPGLSLVNDTVATPHLLLDDRIRALTLPSTDEAPAGTPLQITAYNDLPQIAGYTGLEVTSLTLTSLPLVVDEDSDNDLLADSWELRHFGTLAHDTLMNRDGSLYSLAQEYLDGTDPRSASSSPVLAPVLLALRDFHLASLGGGSFSISADWPPAYANAIDVMIESSPDLIEWFLPNPAPYIGSGEFRETFSNSDPRFFYRAFPALRR
jgi:hypothetical protein